MTALFSGAAASQQQTTAAAAAPPAPATGNLQEVVVTAEKRSESLQDLPGSVAALTAEDLTQRGISGVASLMAGDVPSVRIEPFAGNPTVLEVAMRGFIDPNGTDITNENPVPIYIDDVYYGRQTSTALELNDLERIEVLRGPQGTLFGKNAEGGALRLVSKEPTGEFGFDGKAEGGNYGYWKGVAHLNLPAMGAVSAKIDLLGSDNNGFTTNPAADQYNYGVTKSTGAKLTLLYKPSEALRIEYAGDWTSLKSSEYWNAQISYSPTGSPYNSVWGSQTSFPSSEPYATYRPLDPQIFWGQRLNVDFTVSDELNLRSITAFRADTDQLFNTAAASSVVPGPFFLPPGACPSASPFCSGVLTDPVPEYNQDHRQFSEELQLVGRYPHLDWVFGLFYLHEHAAENEPTYFGSLLPNSIPAAYPYLPVTPSTSAVISPLFGPVSDTGAIVTESSTAAYGQITYRLPGFDDKLGLTAGLRVGRDEKSAERPAPYTVYLAPTYPAFVGGTPPAGLPCPQTPQCSPSYNATEASPMAAVSYEWAKDVSTYARFSTGYQGAGLSVGSQTFQYVAPSKVNSFEVGLKSEFADRTLRFNVAAFYEEWMHPQENVQTTSSSTVEFFSGPTIDISGLELDSAWAPVTGLTFTGSLTLLHGHQAPVVDAYPPPADFPHVTAAFQLPATPKWAASLSATDDIAHTDYGVVRASLQANGTASYYSVPNVEVPIASYWLIDGRLSLADISVGQGGRLELAAWVRNLANRTYNVFIYQIPGPNTDGAFGPPRTFGGSVAYRFN